MAGPVFDPNKPFTIDEAPAFDPNAPFEVDTGPANPLGAGTVQGKKKTFWEQRLEEAQGARPGLDDDSFNKYGPVDVAARGLEYLSAGTNTAFDYLDQGAKNIGLADLPKKLGIDQQLLPGSALGALFEAFPAGGLEAGILPKGQLVGQGARVSPEFAKGLEDLYRSGTADDILDFTRRNGSTIDEAELRSWVADRDARIAAEKPINTEARIEGPMPTEQMELPLQQEPRQTAFDFDRPTMEQQLQEEAAAFRRSRQPEPTADQVFAPREEQLSFPMEQEPTLPFEAPVEAPYETYGSVREKEYQKNLPHLQDIADEVNKVADGWENPPEWEIVHSVDDIADEAIRQQVPSTAKAFVGPDGKVRIIGKNVTKDEVSAITYHEALGHQGMTNLFNEGLDAKLTSMYDTTPWFKNKVDRWLEKNKGAYADAPNRVARAADEVFAQMSEDGAIKSSAGRKLYNQIADTVKEFARRAGLKLEYSPREIRSILENAHATVTEAGTKTYGTTRYYGKSGLNPVAVQEAAEMNGMSREAAQRAIQKGEADFLHDVKSVQRDLDNGVDPQAQTRFKKLEADTIARMAEGEDVPRFYNSEMKSLTAEKIKTVDDIDDALDFIGKEAEKRGLNEGPVTIADSIREAEDLGLNASKYLRSKSLSEKKLSARIAGAKQVLTDQTQELLRLKAKVEAEGMTPSNRMDLQERIATATLVYGRFGNDTAEIARSLRLLREVTESRKLGQQMARFMEGETLDGHLSSPESVMRFLNKLEEASKESPAATGKVLREGSKDVNDTILNNVLNLPRAMMSTFDLSAPFRQGIFMAGSKQFWKGIPEMFKQFYSQAHHDFVMEEIMSRPNYFLMDRAKLALTGGSKLTAKEEAFMTNYAEKIPGFGRVVKASERAYVGFLNKLRADTFDSLIRDYEKAGVPRHELVGSQQIKDIAEFVNAATGRGNMGGYAMGPKLNAMFFSPRLIASRLQLMNPQFYYKLDPIVRKQALKSLISFGALATTVAGLAKMAGANVETDPRSSDFAKIRTGRTRYDILGGFGQYLVLGARLASGQKKQLNGDIKNYGEGYNADSRVDAIVDFFKNKASPLASYSVGLMEGKDAIGQPFDPASEAVKRVIPLMLQDINDLYQEEGVPGAMKAVPSAFGFSTQTFDTPPPRKYDEYGSTVEEGTDDAVSQAVDALKQPGKELVTKAPKSVRIAGEKIDLVGDVYDSYQKKSGDYFHSQMEEVVKLPGWTSASDDDKRQIIKDLLRESRAYAKEELFGVSDDDGV